MVVLKAKWKEVVMRDVHNKIVGFIDKFITIGDVAIQFDPTSAAFPWLPSDFYCEWQLATSKIFGRILHSLEIVLRLVTQYAIFGHIYRNRASKILLEPETVSLVDMYAEILTHLARAKLFIQANGCLY